ncbi:unnamed protein product [Phytophthora lilii]|uniref:Unnamed protein product n=1 Tax=Phytophthora lilii TaxID=2077276 RepID=A0A9W6WFR2_9STRA|nr:unnamed protein product [Phytophthora lilii]
MSGAQQSSAAAEAAAAPAKQPLIMQYYLLSWYAAKYGRAWQLDCGKAALSRASREDSVIQDFRAFLLHHTAEGNLSRQEAVSMVPALLLDVHPHHRVLDMCAAPGSKTAQIMEALISESSASAGGFVVANDANEKRGYLLVHQLQRLGLDNFVVTCHEGQDFPGLYDPKQKFDLQRTNVFDRVLCDVPCSGDGTIRKNRNLWGRWAPGSALTLHPTQIELGLRAAALLRHNGDSIMTYSTCSLNPVENEAVVAELLRRADGALELVDCAGMLPGLITRPGVTSWEVAWQARTAKGEARAALQWFDQYESVPTFLQGSRIPRSMFPPSDENIRKALPRCFRLFPTDQNTGGFFVAVLRKVPGAKLPGRDQRGLNSYEVAATANGERKPSRRAQKLAEQTQDTPKLNESIEDTSAKVVKQTYTKLRADHWELIKDFYGISENFPHVSDCGGARSSVHRSQNCFFSLNGICLFYISQILDTGLRVFARVQAAGKVVFRPTEEGLEHMLPFITKRKAPATSTDFLAILTVPGNETKQVALGLEHFSDPLQDAAEDVRANLGVGPMLMVLPESEREAAKARQLPSALPVWLGDKTLTLLIDKQTRDRLAHASLVT